MFHSVNNITVFKFFFFFSFVIFRSATPLLAQDTSLVTEKVIDINGKEVNMTFKRINYIGMIYPRIYEKTITGLPFNGLSLRDSILVLNFWDIHCPPCIAEMPGLNKLQTDYKNKPVAFLALCMDDPKTVLEKFIVNKRFELRQLFYNDEVKKQNFYCAPGYPVTIIVDRNSRVAYITEGGLITDAAPQEIYNKISVELNKLLK
jgi:thiol-disulfide isomerase/thioredoxin